MNKLTDYVFLKNEITYKKLLDNNQGNDSFSERIAVLDSIVKEINKMGFLFHTEKDKIKRDNLYKSIYVEIIPTTTRFIWTSAIELLKDHYTYASEFHSWWDKYHRDMVHKEQVSNNSYEIPCSINSQKY